MSSYVNFYLKNGKNGTISYLFGYNRGSKVYEVFYDTLGLNKTELGYCNEFLKGDCLDILNKISTETSKLNKRINDYKESIEELSKWNNSLEEKREYSWELKDYINELKEEIDGYDYAYNFYTVLQDIVDFNPEKNTLLAGIDCYASREEEKEEEEM